MTDQLMSTEAILIMVVTALIVRGIRYLIPDQLEETKKWKASLRALPLIVGALLSLVPELCPAEDLVQSITIGATAGSFSSVAYGMVKQSLNDRAKSLLDGKTR